MTKLTWSELTEKQKAEFTKQLQFCGDRNPSDYPKHTYQIKDGKCYGWIIYGQVYNKFNPKRKVHESGN